MNNMYKTIRQTAITTNLARKAFDCAKNNNLVNVRALSLRTSGNYEHKRKTGKSTFNMNVSSDVDQCKPDTAGHAMKKNDGLQTHFKTVTQTMGVYLGTAALSSAGAVMAGTAVANSGIPPDALMNGGIATFVGAFGVSLYAAWKIGAPIYKKGIMVNAEDRDFYAKLMHACMGVTIAPSLVVFAPAIPYAAVVATALVAGPITASLYLPKGQLLPWGPALYVGLWGLVGVGIGGIWFPMLHDVNLYGGVLLFTGYSAYDTHKLISEYERGNKDHIGHATNYSLNAINIFVRMLEIISKIQNAASKQQSTWMNIVFLCVSLFYYIDVSGDDRDRKEIK
jgi:FtsH-binding integral membrane protein